MNIYQALQFGRDKMHLNHVQQMQLHNLLERVIETAQNELDNRTTERTPGEAPGPKNSPAAEAQQIPQ